MLFRSLYAAQIILDKNLVAPFAQRVATGVGTLIFPVAYAIYFNVSTRVRSVFRDRVWNGRAVGVAS